MPFGVVSGVGLGVGVLDGVVIVEGEGAVLEVNLGHAIVTNGAFATHSSQIILRTCCCFSAATDSERASSGASDSLEITSEQTDLHLLEKGSTHSFCFLHVFRHLTEFCKAKKSNQHVETNL